MSFLIGEINRYEVVIISSQVRQELSALLAESNITLSKEWYALDEAIAIRQVSPACISMMYLEDRQCFTILMYDEHWRSIAGRWEIRLVDADQSRYQVRLPLSRLTFRQSELLRSYVLGLE